MAYNLSQGKVIQYNHFRVMTGALNYGFFTRIRRFNLKKKLNVIFFL